MESPDRTEHTGLVSAWRGVVRRRWKAGLLVFAAVFGLSAAIVLLSHPVYLAEARLRLGEPPPMSGVTPGAGLFGLFQMGGDPFSNDLELLASRTLGEGVVRDAALNAAVDAPRGWHRDSLFQRFTTTPGTIKASYELRWTDAGVRVSRTAPRDSVVGTVPPGGSIAFDGVELSPLPWRSGMPRRIGINTVPYGEAVHRTRESLDVERARREANVVEISFRSSDPAVAEAVVASSVARFIELRTAIQRRESGQTVDSLRQVANETMDELRTAEQAMEDLQRSTGLVAPEAQSEAFVERYSEAVAQLNSARAEYEGITALLARVEGAAEPADAWADLGAYPAFLQNDAMGAQFSALTTLNEQRTEIASRRSPESREMRVLTDQIAMRDASLRAVARGYRTALGERIGLLEAQLRGIQGRLDDIPRNEIELGRRYRSVRVLSEVLVMTEQRLRQEELRQALTFSNVQVIDPPELQHKPVWPRKTLGLGIGFLLAGVFGLMAITVAERADPTVRSAGELRALTGAPVLAVAVRDARGRISLTARGARRLLEHGAERLAERSVLTLAPVGAEAEAEAVAEVVREAITAGGSPHAGCTEVRVTPASGAGGSVAPEDGSAVVLVGVCRRSDRGQLRRMANRLTEGGVEIRGTVFVCSEVDAGEIWS